MPIKVTISNNKGGAGKTTTVTNTAAPLGLAGFKVLVVDTDPKGDATLHLGGRQISRSTDRHLVSLIDQKQLELSDVVIPSNVENVSLVASHPSLKDTPLKYVNSPIQFALLRRIFGNDNNEFLNSFDYVFFDTNPALNGLLASALDISDYYLITMFPEVESVSGFEDLQDWLETITSMGAKNASLLGILITNFDKNISVHIQALEDIDTITAGRFRVFETKIPTSQSVKTSAYLSTPLVTLRKGSSSAAVAYATFAAELLNLISEMENKGQEKQKNLNRLINMENSQVTDAASASHSSGLKA